MKKNIIFSSVLFITSVFALVSCNKTSSGAGAPVGSTGGDAGNLSPSPLEAYCMQLNDIGSKAAVGSDDQYSGCWVLTSWTPPGGQLPFASSGNFTTDAAQTLGGTTQALGFSKEGTLIIDTAKGYKNSCDGMYVLNNKSFLQNTSGTLSIADFKTNDNPSIGQNGILTLKPTKLLGESDTFIRANASGVFDYMSNLQNTDSTVYAAFIKQANPDQHLVGQCSFSDFPGDSSQTKSGNTLKQPPRIR